MNIKLRAWQIDDLDSLVNLANNPAIAKNMTDAFPNPYTVENGKSFLAMAMKEPIHIFAIEVNGSPAGAIGIHPQTDIHQKNAELGYWLAEPFWGKGIITEAIRQVVPLAFKLYDITRLFARPFGSNTASQKALVKAGFTLEANIEKSLFKNGVYLDELIYSIRREHLKAV